MNNNFSDISILIIDDEEIIRTTMTLILESHGIFVKTAENEAIALAYLKKHKFNVIFLDLYFPEINGLDICARLKKNYPDIPIILMTGFENELSQEKIKSIGAFDYLIKPVSINTLFAIIRSATEIKS